MRSWGADGSEYLEEAQKWYTFDVDDIGNYKDYHKLGLPNFTIGERQNPSLARPTGH